MIKQKVVIDSDIIIDTLRGVEKAKKFLKNLINEYEIYFSTIVEAEVYSGESCSSTEEQKIVEDLFALMHRVPVSEDIAKKAGALRRKIDIKLPDAIIAATAFTLRTSKIATRNKKHFDIVPEINILSF